MKKEIDRLKLYGKNRHKEIESELQELRQDNLELRAEVDILKGKLRKSEK